MVSTYLAYQRYTHDLAATLQRTAAEPQVSRESAYYQENIGKVASVDGLLDNYRLYSYAMKAYGLEDMTYAKAFMRKVLESDLSDSTSFANKLTDKRFADFAATFNFATDGAVTSAAIVQAGDQEDETTGLYTQKNAEAVNATSADTAYYRQKIGEVSSVDGLIGNSRLYRFALASVGLDADMTSKTAVRNALTSDLSDPNSAANKLRGGFLKLAGYFNFETDGNIKAGYDVQSSTQKDDLVDLYARRAGAGVSDARATLDTLHYLNGIGNVKSIDDLLGDRVSYNYVLTAYGIDPANVSKTTIRKVLESDVSDSASFVNQLGDARLQKLAAAFNFDADGAVASQRLIQSVDAAAHTVSLYQNKGDGSTYGKYLTAKETDYYGTAIASTSSLDELLGDDRLVGYVLKAYGLEGEDISTATLRKVLTSDLSDPDSYANSLGDMRYRDLAAAFNFGVDGAVVRARSEAQSAKAAIVTTDHYVRQTLENEAGDDNEGVRLALYTERKASSIDSAYDILGDKALLQVVRTALGLSTSMSSADIDVQADILTKRLDFSLFEDSGKLGQFLSQFCAMYDAANGDATGSTTASLFGSSGGVVGFDDTLIASLQSMKAGA